MNSKIVELLNFITDNPPVRLNLLLKIIELFDGPLIRRAEYSVGNFVIEISFISEIIEDKAIIWRYDSKVEIDLVDFLESLEYRNQIKKVIGDTTFTDIEMTLSTAPITHICDRLNLLFDKTNAKNT